MIQQLKPTVMALLVLNISLIVIGVEMVLILVILLIREIAVLVFIQMLQIIQRYHKLFC